MNYATWKLNFSVPQVLSAEAQWEQNWIQNYGTGPEAKIAELGFGAEGAWADGEVQNGATIMGYVTEPQDEALLTVWEFQNITQAEALEFCLAINPQAYLLPDGTITAPREETTA